MDSKTYWQLRNEENARLGDKSTAELLSSMQRTYNNSLKDIQKEIEAFYGRYADANGLTIAEVNKHLDPSELKSAKQAIKEYYDFAKPDKIGPGMSKKYRDELRLLSARAYMSRLEDLKINLKQKVIELGAKENGTFTESFNKLYDTSYNKNTFYLDKFKGFSAGFESLTSDQLQKVVEERWLGNNYSDRIWTNKGKLLDSIENTFLSGIARGQNARKIALDIQKDYGTSFYNCERLARTESQHILNAAAMQSYKDTGVTQYEFVADLSERTCPICGAMDGQVFDVKEKIEGVNYPVLHPNCRCTTVPYFEKDEIDEMFDEDLRAARDGEGKLYYVPQSINYTKWREMTSSKPTYDPSVVPDDYVVGVGVESKLKEVDSNRKVEDLYENISKYTKDEIEAIDEYIKKFDGVNMNTSLNKNKLDKLSKKQIEDIMMKLDHAVRRNKTTKDITVIRAIKPTTMKDMFTDDQIKEIKVGNFDSLGSGRKWKQNGFMSTSWNTNNNVVDSDLYLLINVPKGTPVIPMNSKVTNKGMKSEKELLLGRGYTIVSTGNARKIDDKNYLVVNLIKE